MSAAPDKAKAPTRAELESVPRKVSSYLTRTRPPAKRPKPCVSAKRAADPFQIYLLFDPNRIPEKYLAMGEEGLAAAADELELLPLYATHTEEDAASACVRAAYLASRRHFEAWCAARGLEPDFESVFPDYMEALDGDLWIPEYIGVQLSAADMASMARQAFGCRLVMGMPGESPAEAVKALLSTGYAPDGGPNPYPEGDPLRESMRLRDPSELLEACNPGDSLWNQVGE